LAQNNDQGHEQANYYLVEPCQSGISLQPSRKGLSSLVTLPSGPDYSCHFKS